MGKEYNYSPSEAVCDAPIERMPSKRTKALAMASAIWTLVCTLYSIVSVCSFVLKGWVDTTFSRVLIVMLAVYIVIFIVLAVLTLKNPQKRKGDVKAYKKTLGIFKAFVNVVYLAISAVSMAGIASGETSFWQWVVFGVTFLIALVQLGLKIASFIFKSVTKAVGKKFKVEVARYRDGKKRGKNAVDSVEEHLYK